MKTFDSKSLGTPVTYVAYLPADYETSEASYPVITAAAILWIRHRRRESEALH